MKTRTPLWGIFSIILIFVLIFIGCTQPVGNSGTDDPVAADDTVDEGIPILDPPLHVHAVALSVTSVKITWDPVAGATGYTVYWSEDNIDFYWIDTVTGLFFIDDDEEFIYPDSTYYYAVTSTGSNESESELSEIVPVHTPTITTVPAAPLDITATALSSSIIKVEWPLVSNAQSYDIYRSTSSSGTYNKIGSTTGTVYTNTGLPSSTPYYYKVIAINDIGPSSLSSYAAAMTHSPPVSVPSAPTILDITLTSNDAGLRISWDAVPGASTYNVYRGNAKYGSYTTKIASNTPNTVFDDMAVNLNTVGNAYFYQVAAVNTAGEGSRSGGRGIIVPNPLVNITVRTPSQNASSPWGLRLQIDGVTICMVATTNSRPTTWLTSQNYPVNPGTFNYATSIRIGTGLGGVKASYSWAAWVNRGSYSFKPFYIYRIGSGGSVTASKNIVVE
jgi:fibronectin type 3 domain-containing protein